jgi:hypothetical protein
MEKRTGHCLDCRVDTFEIKEYYMVHDELWQTVITNKDQADRKYLCINCLEKRLGRRLRASDFMDVPLNQRTKRMSALLLDRLNAAR